MTWEALAGRLQSDGRLQGSSISGEVTYLSVLMWTQAGWGGGLGVPWPDPKGT